MSKNPRVERIKLEYFCLFRFVSFLSFLCRRVFVCNVHWCAPLATVAYASSASAKKHNSSHRADGLLTFNFNSNKRCTTITTINGDGGERERQRQEMAGKNLIKIMVTRCCWLLRGRPTMPYTDISCLWMRVFIPWVDDASFPSALRQKPPPPPPPPSSHRQQKWMNSTLFCLHHFMNWLQKVMPAVRYIVYEYIESKWAAWASVRVNSW